MDYGHGYGDPYGAAAPYGTYDHSDMSAYSEYQSGASNFSTLPVVSSHNQEGERAGSAAYIGACMVCLCFLGIIIIVFVLMQASSTGGGDDVIEVAGDSYPSGGSTGGSPGGGTLERTSSTTDSTTQTGAETTESEETEAPTPVQTPPSVGPPPQVVTTTEVKTTTQEPAVKELVCTVGRTAVLPVMYPKDGLCDYIYYTYVVVAYGRIRASTVKRSWTLFQARAKTYKTTGPGISFDARYLTTVQLRNRTVQEQLKKLAEDNIKHYGLLNTIAQDSNLEKMLREVWAVVEELKNIQNNSTSRKVIIALGMPDYSSGASWDSYGKLLKKTVENSLADTVIAISSTGMIESEQDCYAAPPTVIKAQMNIFPSLDRFALLVSVSTLYGKKTAVVGLSIEMSVMTYILDGDAPNPAEIPYKKCQSAGMDAPHITCPASASGNREELDISTQAGFIIPNQRKFVFMAETWNTIIQKLNFMKSQNQRRRTAWLVYNVHMTDIQRACLTDRHLRLEALKSKW